MEAVTAFVVYRSQWLRNTKPSKRSYHGKLLTPEGTRCCLGFHCRAAGVPDEKMLNKSLPGYLHMNIPGLAEHAVGDYYHDSVLTTEASGINDSSDTTDAEKEALLIPLFAAHGITISFED